MKRHHFIVYVTWSVIQKWKRRHRTDGSDETQPELPYAYASNQVRLFRRAKPGDVVWVLSSPHFSGYRLPPSLIARLKVSKIVDQQSPVSANISIPEAVKGWQYVVLADPSQSLYYPINNAYHTLLSLTFEGKSPTMQNCPHCKNLYEEGKGLYAGIPSHLQTVRQLAPISGDKMEIFSNSVANGQIFFLSYRRSEVGPRVLRLVERLTDENISCWYDNWMIPRPIARGDIIINEKLLSAVLIDGMRQSTYFLAMVTSTYHRKKWTELEWQNAIQERTNQRRRRPLRLVEIMMGGKASGQADFVIRDDGSDLRDQLIAGIPDFNK